ncbi:MAG: phosphoribosylformylglycinamidine cyclo-ligase [Ignavibacteriaceae bacterium]|nr:phosphoribosylformylglycinamidine cyclo-ligase [Ignavibacteriaceae bacterium]
MSENYESAGVSINAGNEAVEKIKNLASATFNKNVLSNIGHFGAFYEIDTSKYKNPVLVSSVDGVGTKLKIAFALNIHNTIGQDLVNHCVNDIAVCGAEPLYFLNYMGFEKLDTNISTSIVEGFAKACSENNCALIGGETAEMPGFYQTGEYDIAGTIVGVVEKSKIINGSRIEKRDVVIGFNSNGLHTNGYSLARKVLLNKFDITDKIESLNLPLGEELLKTHKSYLKLIRSLVESVDVKGFSHITGGGIEGNTRRIVPTGFNLKINWRSWEAPAIFNLIQDTGDIDSAEMRKVFNLGIGLVAVIPREQEELALQLALELGEQPLIIGEIK